ncbi:hypothetical protein JAAARDRAFT_53762 [Jaapia argillacea MUCL 33604]|uniref:F-box domain-containing protein n=1 Tax=Jaapia argillacea MUCL 33604 TaxID=933084 RepID=A0A067Q9D8_9AGAM|nr:hypothetical protein JAAARDRAFT_53762 [Jaapia argillacea MUCL 33604]
MAKDADLAADYRNPALYLIRALAELEDGKYNDAEETLTAVLNLEHSRRGDIIKALCLRGTVKFKLGKTLNAGLDWRAVITIDPGNQTATRELLKLVVGGDVVGDIKTMKESKVSIEKRITPTLPNEIWEHIGRQLPTTDLRTCLSVCQTLHTVALSLLFESLTLKVGVYFNETSEQGDRNLTRTVEILEKILVDDNFASSVKHLSFHALGQTAWPRVKPLLLRCFPRLTGLVTFRWYFGVAPEMGPDVVQALTKHVPHLENLHISGKLFRATGIQKFRYLRELTITGFDQSKLIQKELRATLVNNKQSLSRLTLATPLVLENILTPETYDPQVLEHIHLWEGCQVNLRQATLDTIVPAVNLQSLELLVSHGKNVSQFFGSNEGVFPNLRSFSLATDDRNSYDWNFFKYVGMFLKDRPALERLHLADRLDAERLFDALRLALPTLTGLKALKVGPGSLRSMRLSHALNLAPRTLEVFSIETWGFDEDPVEVASLFRGFPHMKTLILRDVNDTATGGVATRIPTLLQQEAHRKAKRAQAVKVLEEQSSLDRVGLGEVVFDVHWLAARGNTSRLQLELADLSKLYDCHPADVDDSDWVVQLR